MCLQPKNPRGYRWINTGLVPPRGLIPAAMHFAMVSSAEGHNELVTDFAAQCRGLGKAQVMGIGGTPTADQAGLPGNRSDVIPIANATWCRQRLGPAVCGLDHEMARLIVVSRVLQPR
jgi:hypothetical protein